VLYVSGKALVMTAVVAVACDYPTLVVTQVRDVSIGSCCVECVCSLSWVPS
jgi:hypothetical protein